MASFIISIGAFAQNEEEITTIKLYENGREVYITNNLQIDSIIFTNYKYKATDDYEYIDLGLSVKWATRNLDANKNTDLGGFYSLDSYTLYNYTYSDDYAYQILGENWHTPSKAEWEELIQNTYSIRINDAERSGYLYISKVAGYEGNSIFIPVNSYLTNDTTYSENGRMSFWYFSTYNGLFYPTSYWWSIRPVYTGKLGDSNKYIRFAKYSEQDAIINVTDKSVTIPITVCKTNNSKFSADAAIEIMTEEEINEKYKYSYNIVPSELYTINNKVHLSENEHETTVEITFTAEQTLALDKWIKENESGTNLIPLKLTSNSDDVKTSYNYVLYELKMHIPTIESSLEEFISDSNTNDYTQPILVNLDIDNEWDFTIDVEIGDETDVANYNLENGTNYNILPTEFYTIDNKATFVKDNSEAWINLEVKGSMINKGDFYVLPIRLKQNGSTNFEIKECFTYIVCTSTPLYPHLSRAHWTITGDTEEDTGENNGENGRFWCAIDGDLNTFWHTKWSGYPIPVLPINLDIKMEATHTIQSIGLINRQGCPWVNHPSGEFYVSKDGETWEKVGTFTLNEESEEEIFDVDMEKATDVKYLRVTFTSVSHGDTDTCLSEINAYGY